MQHKLVFIETTDVLETTLALDNFRRACDCGRGAAFFSVARGKVHRACDTCLVVSSPGLFVKAVEQLLLWLWLRLYRSLLLPRPRQITCNCCTSAAFMSPC